MNKYIMKNNMYKFFISINTTTATTTTSISIGKY